jgi:NADPH:quinone reductase-like Zn-dependent oxidoreductase
VDVDRERFEDAASDVDVVLDLVGGDMPARSWAVLGPHGVLVSVVDEPPPNDRAGSDARGVYFIVEPDRVTLTELAAGWTRASCARSSAT